MKNFHRLAQTLEEIFPAPPQNVRELRQIAAIKRIFRGDSPEAVSKELKLQRAGLEREVQAVRKSGLSGFLPLKERTTAEELQRRRLGIAQMLLGALAERRFEEITDEITGGGVLKIEDHRPSRTDTDYRLLNGGGKPICRLNIKFHGTLFRDARRYVDLEPEDCFPLATYKINNALKRQEGEGLPYVFLVLSVPDLSAGDVGKLVPDEYVWTLAALKGKMVVEERIVEVLRARADEARFRPIFEKMPEGQFRVLGAQKAYNLLKEKLFDRVHALSLKGFTRRFRNAEVDMHLSLPQEMTPVRAFLELIMKESPQKAAVLLYRGDY